MRLSVDTNILVYAAQRSDEAKSELARLLLAGALFVDSCIAQQVYGEFFNVCHRRQLSLEESAKEHVQIWQQGFNTLPTQLHDYSRAFELASRYRLQYWDALILTVVRAAGVTIFLTEDMQDGLQIGDMKILNPFAAHNRAAIEPLLLK